MSHQLPIKKQQIAAKQRKIMMQQAGINDKNENQTQELQPVDYAQKTGDPFDSYHNSINITKEALRIGKLPIEQVANNIAKGLYTLKDPKKRLPCSPRVLEIINQSDQVNQAFKEKG